MKKFILSLSAITLIAFTSCEKKESVAVNEEQEVAVVTEGAQTFAVDTNVSAVEWHGFKIFDGEESDHNGFVKLKSGEINLEDNKIVAGNFTIDVTSFESVDLNESPEDKAKLDGHLKSADFLDVEKYPEATFEITSVSDIEGEYNTEIKGNLKLRDLAKEIPFKANVGVEDGVLTLKSEEFGINRKDFGVNFQSPKGAAIQDVVNMKVNITANLK